MGAFRIMAQASWWAAMVLVLLLVSTAAGQHRAPETERKALLARWWRAYDAWLRIPDEDIRQIDTRLRTLRQRYPEDPALRTIDLYICAATKDWARARTVLDESSVSPGRFVEWRIHVYWRQRDWRSLVRSPDLHTYLASHALRLVLPTVVFIFAWWLSKRTGIPILFKAGSVSLALAILTEPYRILSGILVAGAPYPIDYRETQISELWHLVLLYGTLALLIRTYIKDGEEHFRSSGSSWLWALAAALMAGVLVREAVLPIVLNPKVISQLANYSAWLNWYLFIQLGILLFVRDVSLSLFFVRHVYQGARVAFSPAKSLGLVLLLSMGSGGWWWSASEVQRMVIDFGLLTLVPAVLLYEWRHHWFYAVVPFWWSTALERFRSILEWLS